MIRNGTQAYSIGMTYEKGVLVENVNKPRPSILEQNWKGANPTIAFPLCDVIKFIGSKIH